MIVYLVLSVPGTQFFIHKYRMFLFTDARLVWQHVGVVLEGNKDGGSWERGDPEIPEGWRRCHLHRSVPNIDIVY